MKRVIKHSQELGVRIMHSRFEYSSTFYKLSDFRQFVYFSQTSVPSFGKLVILFSKECYRD